MPPTNARDGEQARLATLQALDLIESEPDPALLSLLEATRLLLGVDAAALGVVDAEFVHLKGRRLHGVPPRIPRPVAFATAVLDANGPLVVEDARLHPKFAESLGVAGRFFAGCPVRAANRQVIGALIVASQEPRPFSREEASCLVELANAAEALIVNSVTNSVFCPDGTPPGSPEALVALVEAGAERLLVALGARARRPSPIRVDIGRTSYDPVLLRLVLRKHAIDVLRHLLHNSPARFKDLIGAVPGLNHRTLTTRLAEMKAHGLIRRRAFDEVPLRVEYDVPEDARELIEELIQLTAARR